MNVPKQLTFEVESKTVLKILNILYNVLLTQSYYSRACRIRRHVLYHSAAKSEKEISQLAAGYREVVWSRSDVVGHDAILNLRCKSMQIRFRPHILKLTCKTSVK